MILDAKNIGRFEKFSIELNGLTLIAGINSSGKSTIGKSLYLAIKASAFIDKNLLHEKVLSASKALNSLPHWENTLFDDEGIKESAVSTGIDIALLQSIKKLREFFNSDRRADPIDYNSINTPLIKKALDETIQILSHPQINKWIYKSKNNTLPKSNISGENSAFSDAIQLLKTNSNDLNSEFINKLVDHLINSEFKKQVVNLFGKQSNSNIMLSHNNQILSKIVMNDSVCTQFSHSNIIHFSNVIYVDDAFTLDLQNSIPYGPSYSQDGFTMRLGFSFPYSFRMGHKTDLINSLALSKNDTTRDLVEDIQLAKTIKIFDDIIFSLLQGNLQFSDKTKEFVMNIGSKEIDLSNISSGTKSIGILDLLIRSGFINGNSCLILDEPEAHLHPEWQIQLAKLLVAIVAETQLSLLINSHSPFFIEAIQTYSKIYHLEKQTKFYLAQSHNEYFSDLTNATDDPSIIYDALAKPYAILDEEYMGTLK